MVESGIAIAQRIKSYPGITGLSLPRVHIDGVVWHLDVGSSHPGAVAGRPLKGWAGFERRKVRYPARGVAGPLQEDRDSSDQITIAGRISERSWYETGTGLSTNGMAE